VNLLKLSNGLLSVGSAMLKLYFSCSYYLLYFWIIC
jgi:hypothetical protein